MRICIVTYSFYQADHRVRRYGEALAGMGHKVDVLALRKEGGKKRTVLEGVNLHGIQNRGFKEKGLLGYAGRNLLFFLRVTALLSFRQFRYPYKVIHINNPPDFLVFAAFIPKLLGAKIILDMHENLPEFYSAKFKKGSETRVVAILLFLEKVSTRFADRIIAAHDLLRERIIRRDAIPPENCTALLNYPDLRRFHDSATKSGGDDFTIIYPGTTSYHHGLDIAIKALAIVKRELPRVKLNIYTKPRGDAYYHSLTELVEELNLKNNVTFFKEVSNEEIAKILQNENIGIAPKRDGIFASEALSTKIFDYMAAGIPAITSRTKIDEYYFNDSMVKFFEPENHNDLAECILDLYHNPEKGQMLVRNAKRFIGENNWEAKKAIYWKIIEDLTSQPVNAAATETRGTLKACRNVRQ